MGKVLSCGLSRAVPAARGTQVSLACGRPESVGQAGCGVWCVCGAGAVAGRGASSPEAPAWQESGGSVCRGRWVGTRGLEERPRVCDEGAWPVLGTAAMAGKNRCSHTEVPARRPQGSVLAQGTSVCGHPLTSAGRSPLQREGTSLWTKPWKPHISVIGSDLARALS